MNRDRIEPTLLLLFAGLVLFTVVLIVVDRVFNGEGQVFQIIAGLVTGFGAAFLARMKPPAQEKPPDPPGTLTTTSSLTATPPEPAKPE